MAWRPSGENESQFGAGIAGQPAPMRMVHGAGVKGGDLVVVQVRDEVGLRRELIGKFADQGHIQAQLLHPQTIRGKVAAGAGKHQRFVAQQREVVGDVAGASAELAPEIGNVEGYVEDMYLVGQDVFAESPAEQHDVVIGERAADDGYMDSLRLHGARCPFLAKPAAGWVQEPLRVANSAAKSACGSPSTA